MAEVIINDQYLTDLAAAIRKKGGTADTFTPGELAAAIDNLELQPAADDDLTKYIEGTLTQINDDTITTVNDRAFYSMPQLTEVILPNVIAIGAYVFNNCKSLYRVKLGSATMSGEMFAYCYSLKILDTSAKNINTTLYGDSHIGSEVDSIPNNRDDYPYFETIILRTEEAVCNLAINSYYNEFNDTSFYVPAKLINDYKAKYPYIYQFKAIEDYPEICG